MLNDLLKPIFLDFQFWYDLDLWDSNYESYSIIENGEIVSNICLFKSKLQYQGKVHNALSVGAVATKREYRSKGYSRMIMEHIIEKYPDTIMYLSANENVVNFYPLFGFTRVFEKLPVIITDINNSEQPVKLSFDDPKVWHYVKNRKNFSHKLDCLNTENINLFHIYWGYLKDCLYEITEFGALIVAKQNGTTLKLKAIFTENIISFDEIKHYLPFRGITRVEFGFTPDCLATDFHFEEYEADPLFVRGVKCDIGEFKFPELSIT